MLLQAVIIGTILTLGTPNLDGIVPHIGPDRINDIKIKNVDKLEVEKQYTVELVGWLSAYDEMPSKYTLEYRKAAGHVNWGSEVYIATGNCEYVGWTGIMEWIDTGHEVTVQVFDCSGEWDGGIVDGKSVLNEAGYAAELDYASYLVYPLGKVRIQLNKP